MATTALEIGDMKLKFMTVPKELVNDEGVKMFTQIDLFMCDSNFIPYGKPSHSISDLSEEEYHKSLRLECSKKGHFKEEQSTNEEWNSNYITNNK